MRRVVIEPARALDAGVVGGILTEANLQLPWLPSLYTAAEDIRHAGDMIDAGWVRVARTGEQPVGFIARCGAEVHALYVLPDLQQSGVGTALLNDAKTECRTLRLWSYQQNQWATQFYASRGFAELERTDGYNNEAKLPDIRFEWTRSVN